MRDDRRTTRPNTTKPNSERGNGNVTGAHLEAPMYGGRVIGRLLPSIVAEPIRTRKPDDHRRGRCRYAGGCAEPHLKGSDYCPKHDNGERPSSRSSD